MPIYQQDYASGAPYDAPAPAPVDALVGGVPVIQQTDAAAAAAPVVETDTTALCRSMLARFERGQERLQALTDLVGS